MITKADTRAADRIFKEHCPLFKPMKIGEPVGRCLDDDGPPGTVPSTKLTDIELSE